MSGDIEAQKADYIRRLENAIRFAHEALHDGSEGGPDDCATYPCDVKNYSTPAMEANPRFLAWMREMVG